MSEHSLSHYSRFPLGDIYSVPQRPEPEPKPSGLWVSVDGEDDWPSWCRSEEWGLKNLAVAHRIELHSDATILRLRSAPDIAAFHETYLGRRGNYRLAPRYIHWSAVAKEYQGIIIAPYSWHHRLMTDASDWYSGWDCASGCIWDRDAIARVFELPECAAGVAA